MQTNISRGYQYRAGNVQLLVPRPVLAIRLNKARFFRRERVSGSAWRAIIALIRTLGDGKPCAAIEKKKARHRRLSPGPSPRRASLPFFSLTPVDSIFQLSYWRVSAESRSSRMRQARLARLRALRRQKLVWKTPQRRSSDIVVKDFLFHLDDQTPTITSLLIVA